MTAIPVAMRPRVSKQMILEVVDVRDLSPKVRSFSFASISGQQLPAFVPGSHIVVELGSKSNSYSLTGSGQYPDAYTISVALAPKGNGGSKAMHQLQVGDSIKVSYPRSAFAPVASARHHLFIAAGIGITPILSHARAAEELGRSSSLMYVFRPTSGVHLQECRSIYGTTLTEYTDRESFNSSLRSALLNQPIGTHLYVCGPAGFMSSVLRLAEEMGWPTERLHSEHFEADVQGPGKNFQVTLAQSGQTITVPGTKSLLEALEGIGISVPNMCRKGVCGECAVPVLKGRVEHRDLYLTDEEKALHETVMCCVSRAQEQELELDL